MLANSTNIPVNLNARQVVATFEDQTDIITESKFTHGEMIGIMETDTKYRKRDRNVRDFNTVNQHLADGARLPSVDYKDEEPNTLENVEINAPKELHRRTRALIRKQELVWS